MFDSSIDRHSLTRRTMLNSSACGFGYLAFAALAAEQAARAAPATQPAEPGALPVGGSKHYVSPLTPTLPPLAAKAKRVIFLFMQGAPSHVDTFDYKPALTAGDGKPGPRGTLLGSPWQFKQNGKSGLWLSELFPNLGKVADDLCMINSMHTDNPAHPQATLQMHTGSALFVRPSLGSWVLYGLGTQNQDLPGFITINPPGGVGGAQNYGSGFLPAAYEGTRVDGARLIPNIDSRLASGRQRRQIDLIQSMNRETLARGGGENPQIEGLIESYELGFRMQSAVPDVMDLSKESKETHALYGADSSDRQTSSFGKQCLMARRLIENGVRFVEVATTGWDHHAQLKERLPVNCAAVDQPVYGLLTDLKRRGLLKDTLVLFGGEFGRTPYAQGRDGRDHNHRGFSMFMAGGGVKGGFKYGATDDIGYKAVENPMHIHDLHATLLNMLGLDHEKLTYRYAGRDFRLTDVYGNVAKEIIA